MTLSGKRVSRQEGFEKARIHDQKTSNLRSEAAVLLGRAGTHERWATKWRDWADDEYGDVPYPGNRPIPLNLRRPSLAGGLPQRSSPAVLHPAGSPQPGSELPRG